MKQTILLTAVLGILCVCDQESARADSGWLFASLLENRKLITFERDRSTGALIKRHEYACPAEPAFLAVAPDQSTLLVSFRSSGQLASFRIDHESGELTLVSTVEGGQDPAYLECDRTGQFVVSAYYVSNKVSVHGLSQEGVLTSKPVCTQSTAARAHGVAFDSENRFVFVPHTGSNRIYQFHFDATSGMITPNKVPFLETPKHAEPRHLLMHPGNRWAYASHEAGDSVGVYTVDTEAGVLQLVQEERSIPASFDGSKNSTARCEITRDGRFVYVANRGHDSVACYSIDQKSGRVTSLGQVSTEATPRSLTIDSSGVFVYVAGQSSGRIASYRITTTGLLKRVGTYEAGPVAWCVLSVDKVASE